MKVEKIQKEAEQKFRSKEQELLEQELLEKLNKYQIELENIQKGNSDEDGENILTESETIKIEEFRNEMVLVRSELRKVQNALRKDIENP